MDTVLCSLKNSVVLELGVQDGFGVGGSGLESALRVRLTVAGLYLLKGTNSSICKCTHPC